MGTVPSQPVTVSISVDGLASTAPVDGPTSSTPSIGGPTSTPPQNANTGEPSPKKYKLSPPVVTPGSKAPPVWSQQEDWMRDTALDVLYHKFFDTNKNGSVDFTEFGVGCQKVGFDLTIPIWNVMSIKEQVPEDHFKASMSAAYDGTAKDEWKDLYAKCTPTINEIVQKIKEIIVQAQIKVAKQYFTKYNNGSDGPMGIQDFMTTLHNMNVKEFVFASALNLFQISSGKKGATAITIDQWLKLVTDHEAREELCKYEECVNEIKGAQLAIKSEVHATVASYSL